MSLLVEAEVVEPETEPFGSLAPVQSESEQASPTATVSLVYSQIFVKSSGPYLKF